ncbi:MAG TPA: hypothetical protein VIF62_21590 [Labilithrix sp.]
MIERPGWLQIVTPSTPGTYQNEIVFSALEPREVDDVIEREIARCRDENRPLKWCVGPWTRPADFGERLARRGFESWDVRGMSIASDAPIATPDGLDVFTIEGGEALDRWLRVMLAGWSMPEDQIEAERTSYASALAQTPPAANLFAVRDARTDEWLATAGLGANDAYGYLVGGQVLERARGRGAYRALVAARLAWLRARSIPFAVTQARAATSAPILARLGFATLFEAKCYVLAPS